MGQTLSDIADQMEARARELKAEGKHEAAVELALAAADVRKAIGAIQGLPPGNYSPRIQGEMMPAEHKEAISRGRSGRKTAALLDAAKPKGYRTLGELAKAVGVGPSMLSQVVRGSKKMPPGLAEKLKNLIGWEP